MQATRRRVGMFIGFTALLSGAFVLGTKIPRTQGAAVSTELASPVASESWTCPMHPDVAQRSPGSCPICGMDLVKADVAALGAGRQSFHIAEQTQRNSGVRTELVESRAFEPTLLVTGQVIADERRAVSLSPKVDGWIRKLGVSVVGQPVRRGQVLYEIYSPDLQLRQREYVEILGRRDTLQAQSGSMKATVGGAAPEMMLGSVARERFRMRSRLVAADMPEALIDEVESSRRIKEVVPVLAEHDGVVTSIGAREGAYVMPSQVVLEYADLSAAWAEVILTVQQLGQLTGKDVISIRSQVDPNVELEVRIDPGAAVVDPATRTARIRLPIAKSRQAFPAGSLFEGEVRLKARPAIVVPQDAVIRTGAGAYVFVETQPSHFQQQKVMLGATTHGRTEVLKGLKAGDKVVVNGQFLLSSEASLHANRVGVRPSSADETSNDHHGDRGHEVVEGHSKSEAHQNHHHKGH